MSFAWTSLKPYELKDSNLKAYIIRLERLLLIDDIVDDQKKINALLSLMPDPILHYYETIQSPTESYQAVKSSILEKFGDNISVAAAHSRLRAFSLNWKESEFMQSLSEYGALIKATVPSLNHEELLATQINAVTRLVNANDSLFNRLLNKCDYKTFSEVVLDLHSILVTNKARKERTSASYSIRRSRKPTKCFYCGRLGHVEADCRTKKRNFTRSSTSQPQFSQVSQSSIGYRPNYSTSSSKANAVNSKPRYSTKPKPNPTSSVVNSVELNKEDRNGPQTIVPLTIQDYKGTALVDTGATVDLIKESVVKSTSQPISSRTRIVRTALGDLKSTKGQTLITCRLGSSTFVSIADVVEDNFMDRCYDMILGTHSLQKLGKITVSWKDRLLFIKKNAIPFIEIESQASTVNEVKIAKPEDTVDVRKEFSDLLDVFNKDKYDIGECTIQVPPQSFTEDKLPPLRRYNFPPSIVNVARDEIEALVKSKVLEPADNLTHLHNLIFVRKEDGSLRPTTDLRPMNKITIKATYPNKSLREMLRIKEAGLFTKLDMTQSFHQFKLDPKDYDRFGVYTPWGCYRYLRLPQGFCNSPSICQEIMDRITRETEHATSFLDDVIISTRPNREFHLQEVRNTLRIFKEYGLKLNEKKCVFMSKEVTFLGHRINYEGISPDKTNVDAICRISQPANLKQLRMFIGAVGFFSMFIPNYSNLMKPLFDLLKKGKPFTWSSDQQTAFQAAKDSLLSNKVLAHYDPLKELYIFTDASQKGYAGILCQKFDGYFRPIMYWSKSRPNLKRNYYSCLIELQAGVLFMRKIKHYMLGNTTIWYTDSKSLGQILSNSDDIKYSSYIDELQHYNLQVKHLPGINNTMADLLSRCDYFQQKCSNLVEPPAANFVSEIDLVGEQSKIEKFLKSKPEIQKVHNFYGIYEKGPDDIIKFKPYLPDHLLEPICKDAHLQGHFSPQKMELMINQCWANEKIRKACEKVYSECKECLFRNRLNNKITDTCIVAFQKPRSCYNLDICGPFPTHLSQNGNRYILLCVDSFSRFWMATPLKTTSTSEVSSTLMNEIIYRYGRAILMKSDNATYLNNPAMEQICKSAGVKLYHGRPYIHTSQSLVERAFLSLENIISKIINSDSQPQFKYWDECLNMAVHFYNNSPQLTLKLSPYELFFGTEPYLDFHTVIEQFDEKLVDRERQFQELAWKRKNSYMAAYQAMLESRLKAAQKLNRQVINFSMGVGKQILLKKTNPSTKFDYIYEGPYTVLESDPYTVKFKKDPNSRKIFHVHLSQIKPYRVEDEPIQPTSTQFEDISLPISSSTIPSIPNSSSSSISTPSIPSTYIPTNGSDFLCSSEPPRVKRPRDRPRKQPVNQPTSSKPKDLEVVSRQRGRPPKRRKFLSARRNNNLRPGIKDSHGPNTQVRKRGRPRIHFSK